MAGSTSEERQAVIAAVQSDRALRASNVGSNVGEWANAGKVDRTQELADMLVDSETDIASLKREAKERELAWINWHNEMVKRDGLIKRLALAFAIQLGWCEADRRFEAEPGSDDPKAELSDYTEALLREAGMEFD